MPKKLEKKKTIKKAEQRTEEKTDYGVGAEEFVAAWQVAESLEEVSEVTGIPKPVCSARASKYRGDGIKLKRMPRKSDRALNVDELNRMIESINKKKGIKSQNDEVKVPQVRKPLTKKEVERIVAEVVSELAQDE